MDKFYRKILNYTLPYQIEIKYKFTDIFILSDKKLDEKKILDKIKEIYEEIEKYSIKKPLFISSLKPVNDEKPPQLFKELFIYSKKTNLGPLAGIAGFFSKKIAEFIKEKFEPTNLIIENGGDIFLKREEESKILIYAGNSPFSMKIGFKLRSGEHGIATSSRTVGHSLSFGNTDSLTVISNDPVISDFYATYFGNIIKNEKDIERALKTVEKISEVKGLIVILNDKIGIYGVEVFNF